MMSSPPINLPDAKTDSASPTSVARFVVATFRADAARAGAVSEVTKLVDELCLTSPEFKRFWSENDVGLHGEGTKRLHHPVWFDFTLVARIVATPVAFAVDLALGPGAGALLDRLTGTNQGTPSRDSPGTRGW